MSPKNISSINSSNIKKTNQSGDENLLSEISAGIPKKVNEGNKLNNVTQDNCSDIDIDDQDDIKVELVIQETKKL